MNSVIFKPSLESPPTVSNSFPQPSAPLLSMRDIARSFQMHRMLALGVAVLVIAGVAMFALSRRPYYETSALVYVQPEKARVVTDPADGAYDSMRYDSYMQQQFQTILRTDTLTDALKDAASAAPKDLWTLPNESVQSAVARLQKALKVERETGSYQISISLSGNDPRAITALVNAVVHNYIAKERADELAQNDQQLELLRQDRVHILDDLNDSTHEQAALSSSLGVADPGGAGGNASGSSSTPNPYDAQLAQLRTELADARDARAIADAQLASVNGHSTDSASSLNAAAEEAFTNDPGMNALKQTISERRSALATQMAGMTAKNPLYQQDQQELKRLDDSMETMSAELRNQEAHEVLGRLQLEAARKEDVEARLEAQLQKETELATSATPRLQRAAAVTADVARLQARFTEVDNAINALELEHDSSGLVHLLLPAELPSKPNTSRRWIILAAAFPFGIGCGLLAALLLYKMDRRIYIAEDVLPVLGFSPMAVLPDPDDVEEYVVDEFMLRLVAGIDQAHSTGGARTYVFSALSPATNITEMVTTLACKMERLGYRTLLLKASAALDNSSSAMEQETRVWSETQLTARGEVRQNQLRRGSVIAEHIEKLTQKADLVFIEALPLLCSAEAEYAARLADITVVVAESGTTTRRELSSALSLVKRLHAAGIAAVLSDVRLRHADEEFLSMVRSAQQRRVERRRRDKPSAHTEREAHPLSILKTQPAIASDRETTA